MTRPTPGAGPLDTFSPGLFLGRTAVVTGGGTGIGRQTALALAHLGANVVVAGREKDRLRSVVESLGGPGSADERPLRPGMETGTGPRNGTGTGTAPRALAVPTDIRDTSSVDALVEAAYRTYGRVDFLVNNAGGQFPAPPSKITDNGWRAVVDLNLNGTWNVLSRFMKPMAEGGYGAVVNVVHIFALDRGAPYFAHSGAARAGVVNLTRTLAPYLAPHGVTINALAPGTIGTAGFVENEARPLGLVGERGDAARERAVSGRLGSAAEVAAAILFLCSPAARFITGSVLVADGGESYGSWPQFWDEGIL